MDILLAVGLIAFTVAAFALALGLASEDDRPEPPGEPAVVPLDDLMAVADAISDDHYDTDLVADTNRRLEQIARDNPDLQQLPRQLEDLYLIEVEK